MLLALMMPSAMKVTVPNIEGSTDNEQDNTRDQGSKFPALLVGLSAMP